MTTPLVQLQQVHRSFANVAVLNGIDLEIQPGDRIVLFGPSGCGKTTLLHLLGLLDRPDRGNHRFRGQDCGVLSEQDRCSIRAEKIGMVFQQFHLLPGHSVRDNVNLRLRYVPKHNRRVASPDELLKQLGLYERRHQRVRVLSGGEKQRVCIARALLCEPNLLLADEPTGNLDPANSDSIRTLFEQVADKQIPVVIATHDTRWFDFASRIFRFEHGRLVEHHS
ncbi:MAG: ATP-binding cassette domain-containing protein [Kiritimatiellia bacterium]